MADQMFGKYVIVRLLGSGGMADVFLARDPMLDRNLAIKVIHASLANDPEFEQRFRHEARVVASLRHPNIVQVYDYDLSNSGPYMVMEYLDGGALKYRIVEYVKRGETMPLDEAGAYLSAMASALDYAHERSLVHRDLKPSNVLFTTKGEPVITDFGIAKILGDATEMTMSGQILGTPAYMSPEQGSGKPIDKRSDIYSLGVILFEMVTGTVPFKGESTTAVMIQHLTQPPPLPRTLNPKLTEAIQSVIIKALAKNPDDRFATAGELARAFSAGLHAIATPAQADDATLIEADAPTRIGAAKDMPIRREAPVPLPSTPPHAVSQKEHPLQSALSREPSAAQTPMTSPVQGAPSLPRISPGVLALGALVLVLLIGAGIFGISRLSSGETAKLPAGEVASLPAASGEQKPTPLLAASGEQKPTPSPAAGAEQMQMPSPTPGGDQKQTPSPEGGSQTIPGMNMPAPSAEGFGIVRFTDGSARADQVLVTLTGVQAPSAGHRYEAWLIGQDGESRLSLGKVDLKPNGEGQLSYVDKDGQNLLAKYNRFELTLEPDPDPSPLPSGVVAYSSGVPAGSFMHIGHLLVAFDDTPNHIGFAAGLVQDARLVKQMTDEMLAANQKSDFEHVLIQAELLVNLIEGKQGQDYGDLDKNGVVSDKSDGYGLLLNGKQNGYIEGSIDHAKLAADSPDATEEIKMHSLHVSIAAKNVDDWSTQLRDLCLKILAAKDNKSVQQEIRTSVALGDRILNGIDLNGDESVDPVPGEAGAIVAYQHAFYMADMPILNGPNAMPTPGPK